VFEQQQMVLFAKYSEYDEEADAIYLSACIVEGYGVNMIYSRVIIIRNFNHICHFV
jgi:hypothetical protein